MDSFPLFWHELGSAADFVKIWTYLAGHGGYYAPMCYFNQGVPDPTIGQIGGSPPGSTCWHALCYAWPYNAYGNIQPVCYHVWGPGALPSNITALSGGNVFPLQNGTFFRIFQINHGGL